MAPQAVVQTTPEHAMQQALSATQVLLQAAAALQGNQEDVEAAFHRLIEMDQLTTRGARALLACGDRISAELRLAVGALLARRDSSLGE